MDNIIMSQLEFYSDKAAEAQEAGDNDLRDFFVKQGYDLIQGYETSLMTLDTEKLA